MTFDSHHRSRRPLVLARTTEGSISVHLTATDIVQPRPFHGRRPAPGTIARAAWGLAVTAVIFLTFARAAGAAPTDIGNTDSDYQTLDPNVVNGDVVPDGKWPDVAAVMANGQIVCTGTLVAPTVVTTAGHCLEMPVTSVLIGATDVNGPGETINVVRQATYPQWQTTYDVAYLVLESASTIAPRAMATSCITSSFLVAGADVALVGYGATDINGSVYDDKLREAVAQVRDPDCSGGDGCMAAVAPGGELTAGATDTNSCFGDSGGPLYLLTTQGNFMAGIVSRGVDSASAPCQGGGIYPRSDAIIDWLETETGVPMTRPSCDNSDPGDPTDPTDPTDPLDPTDPTDPTDPSVPNGDNLVGGCDSGGGGGSGGSGALSALLLLCALRWSMRTPTRKPTDKPH